MAMQEAAGTAQESNIFERSARANPPPPPEVDHSAHHHQASPATAPAQTGPVSPADSQTLAAMLFGEEKKGQDTPKAPATMPAEIVSFMRENNWGQKHLAWHQDRQNGKAPIQEGQAGNGVEFLAMHRGMMQMLRERFPQHAALFQGRNTPPLQGEGPLDPRMQTAYETLQNLDKNAGEFKSDDDLGMFIQSGSGPQHDAKLGSAGIHNYLHMRLSDPKSPIDMGDPTVNIENPQFWQLHGWIDNRWEAFRKARGESADSPDYIKAMQEGMASMHPEAAAGQHQHKH